MIDQIKKISFLGNLVHVRRYSGLLLLKDESVSDHICCMNQLALAIVPEINKRIDKQNEILKQVELKKREATPISYRRSCYYPEGYRIPNIDLKDVIYRISVHDLDESLTLDFPRPIKYANPQITEAIYNTVQGILKNYLEQDLIDDINNSKDYKTRAGCLVSFFDTIQAGLKMQQEIELGNKNFKKEIGNVVELLEEKLSKLDDLNYDEIFTEASKELLTDYINEFNRYV